MGTESAEHPKPFSKSQSTARVTHTRCVRYETTHRNTELHKKLERLIQHLNTPLWWRRPTTVWTSSSWSFMPKWTYVYNLHILPLERKPWLQQAAISFLHAATYRGRISKCISNSFLMSANLFIHCLNTLWFINCTFVPCMNTLWFIKTVPSSWTLACFSILDC